MFNLVANLFFWSTLFGLICNVSASDNFYPADTGSYWMYRDSVFDPAMKEFIGTTTIAKYYIKSSKSTDSGNVIQIEYSLKNDGKWKTPIILEQFLHKNGYIQERQKLRNGKWTDWDLKIAKVNPVESDTCILDSDTFVYQNCKTGNIERPAMCLISPKYRDKKYVFVKGIGKVGSVNTEDYSTNLIEYRIGNGPVNKLHWLMDKPKAP